MNWAKHAADEIVSDDAIDEAESDRTSSSDWMKWALAAVALGGDGFAAWKYSPEIQKTLGKATLFSNKTPTNRALEAVSGGAVTSPAWLGAGLGAATAAPAGIPARIRGDKLLGGASSSYQHLEDMAGMGSRSGPGAGSGSGTPEDIKNVADRTRSEFDAAIGPDKGVSGIQKLHQLSVSNPASGLSRLRAWNPNAATPVDWQTLTGTKMTPDTSYFSGRRAVGETSDVAKRLGRLNEFTSKNVTYNVPSATPGGPPTAKTVRLADVPDAEASLLSGHDRPAWHAHRQIATEAGLDPAKFNEFNPGTLGSAITRTQNIRPEWDMERLQRMGVHGAVGAGIGALGGAAIDTGVKAFSE